MELTGGPSPDLFSWEDVREAEFNALTVFDLRGLGNLLNFGELQHWES